MKKSVALVALLAVLWLALPAAAAAPTVVLGSAVLEVAAGQTEPLSVTVTDVQDLYGLEIHLRFDPAVVQVADADPGRDGIQVAAGDFLSADFVAQNQANNQAGSIDYAVTQVNPNEPRSGSGTLLVIRFQGGAAGGASQLEVTNGILTTRDGDLIPVTFASGEVRVKGAPAVAGNATATPTTACRTGRRPAIRRRRPGPPPIRPSRRPRAQRPRHNRRRPRGRRRFHRPFHRRRPRRTCLRRPLRRRRPRLRLKAPRLPRPRRLPRRPRPPRRRASRRRASRRRRRASQPRRSWRRRPRATRAKRSWNLGPPSSPAPARPRLRPSSRPPPGC